jgi:protein-tyrosine phosphatase
MAEALLRAALPKGSEWVAASAGILCAGGRRASENAVEAIREAGGDLSGFVSRPVKGGMLYDAALVVPMTRIHKALLLQGWPRIKPKTRLLLSFDPDSPPDAEVPDPFGGPLAEYRECRDAISRAIPGLLRFLSTY